MRTVPNANPAVSCHGEHSPSPSPPGTRLRVALVGAPNVGKSALFNRLTGRYVAVSNYPGTTVEISRGHGVVGDAPADIVDTPGMFSLLPTTEEERVARRLVLEGDADVLVHVVDAKHLARMLPLTLQLGEVGRPLVMALNMMDEAERLGIEIDAAALGARLGFACVPIVAVEGRGLDALRAAIARAARAPVPLAPVYGNGVGTAIHDVRGALRGVYPIDPTALAALLIQGDTDAEALVRGAESDGGHRATGMARAAAARFDAPAAYRVAVERQRAAERLLQDTLGGRTGPQAHWRDRLGRWLARPLTGIPALLLVVYLGLYLFVGKFGGGVMVDWLERGVFEGHVNPFFERVFAGVPWPALRSLFVGDYGLLTLGLRYAVAIILPIVGAFFLFFSVIEDSGYLPRLALLVDRQFKRLGLSGRAVIPIVLGFACDTMATMVTRTLETRRERVLATLLLALAIPCSAQLGVILALLAGQPLAFAVWIGVVIGTFVLVGAIGARVLPGERPSFHMELPPLRRPRLRNVLTKTATRMQWYFLEVLPLFLAASVLLWVGQLTGAFALAVRWLTPVVGALGLPAETARVFLFGFFRRDYGAAGLFDLSHQGRLDAVQLAVAGVTLTLFVPCVAQFLMMVKERGTRTALGMVAFITPFAFGVGWLINLVLRGVLR
jgi:ferrous iron transport protein B